MGWDQSYTPLTRPRLNTWSVWHKAQTPSNYYYMSAYQALEPKTALLQVLVQVQVQVLVFCCGQPQCCSYTFASQPSERPLRGL